MIDDAPDAALADSASVVLDMLGPPNYEGGAEGHRQADAQAQAGLVPPLGAPTYRTLAPASTKHPAR